MQFRTRIDIEKSPWKVEPTDSMLFLGSCFADNIGKRFQEECLDAVVNPSGVLYNPASIASSLARWCGGDAAEGFADHRNLLFLTLGTNHVYILNETGEIVDNCRKRPASLFTERELSIEECRGYLQQVVDLWTSRGEENRVIITVSPIRYAKYGYHESQLSKAVLLLAADAVVRGNERCSYFPAYEIMNDELRDYRFYNPDMLHPSQQAVEYIWERFADTYFSEQTLRFIAEWQPIKAALNHRPFDAESEEYKTFRQDTLTKEKNFYQKYGIQYR